MPDHSPQSLEQDIRMLAPGAVLSDRYQIERPLGTGGRAVVYAVYDRELEIRVALKLFRRNYVTPDSLRRVTDEFRSLRDFASPRLIKLFDFEDNPGETFLTSELAEGGSLRDHLLREYLSVDDAIDKADSILEALEDLHRKGVIHQKLKPANVLLTDDGKLKLCDYGLSHHNESKAYLSPEQIADRKLDVRSDVFSFGVLLYEMLAKRLPFGGRSSLGTVEVAPSKTAPDIRVFRPDVPKWLALLIWTLLEIDPDRRPPTITAVRAQLRARTIDREYRWRRVRRTVIVTSTLVTLITVATFGAWQYYWSRFERIETDQTGVLRGYDRKDRELWSRDGLIADKTATAVRVRLFDHWVYSLPGESDPPPKSQRRYLALDVFDGQSGRERGEFAMPPVPDVFSLAPSFDLERLLSADIDHDGLDEIVATWNHSSDWPSYAVLLDPRTFRADPLFYASGNQRTLGTVDVDGDETDEVIFAGSNPRMGDHIGIAAVRIRRVEGANGTIVPASNTPDTAHVGASAPLGFYVLLPQRSAASIELTRVDSVDRVLEVSVDGAATSISFDGFLTVDEVRGSQTERRVRRKVAYVRLREASEKFALGDRDGAIAKGIAAQGAAEEAGDKVLESWIAERLRELAEY